MAKTMTIADLRATPAQRALQFRAGKLAERARQIGLTEFSRSLTRAEYEDVTILIGRTTPEFWCAARSGSAS